jgi:hypothetical protein
LAWAIHMSAFAAGNRSAGSRGQDTDVSGPVMIECLVSATTPSTLCWLRILERGGLREEIEKSGHVRGDGKEFLFCGRGCVL